ncbi:hypothetical protein D3C80_1767020 [compost metagenome]
MRQNIHMAVPRIITAETSCSHGSTASAVKRLLRTMPPKAIIQTIAVCETVAARPSRTACRTVPLIAMIKAAIIVFECPGSSPCNIPSKMAPGMYSHAFPCCKSVEKSFMVLIPDPR